jgi:Na+-driven multidrug efflux pump
MVALGLASASSTLIGQEIGKNNVKEAWEYFKYI